MAITSSDDIAGFRGTGLAKGDSAAPTNVLRAPEPVSEARSGMASRPANLSDEAGMNAASEAAVPGVWVLCRKRTDGDVETVRAFDDEARARADPELAASVSDDEFWIAAVPLIETARGGANGTNGISRVQALALTWLAQGAEAEASVPLDDPVVVSPRHVRGFVSVPSHEWQEMEDRGWVRDGLITPSGADQVGLVRKLSDHNVG